MKRTLEMKLLSVALALIMVFVSYIAMPAKALAEDAEEAAQSEAIEAYADANDFSQDNSLAYSPLVGELREDRDESALEMISMISGGNHCFLRSLMPMMIQLYISSWF